jgi:hypothetical protein
MLGVSLALAAVPVGAPQDERRKIATTDVATGMERIG